MHVYCMREIMTVAVAAVARWCCTVVKWRENNFSVERPWNFFFGAAHIIFFRLCKFIIINIVFVRLYIYECEDIILLFFSTRERSVTIYYKDLPIIISSRCICAHVFGRPVFFVPHIHVQIHTLKTYSHNRIMLYISVYDAHDTLGGEHYDSRTRSKLMIKKKYKYPCVCVCGNEKSALLNGRGPACIILYYH